MFALKSLTSMSMEVTCFFGGWRDFLSTMHCIKRLVSNAPSISSLITKCSSMQLYEEMGHYSNAVPYNDLGISAWSCKQLSILTFANLIKSNS